MSVSWQISIIFEKCLIESSGIWWHEEYGIQNQFEWTEIEVHQKWVIANWWYQSDC